MGLGDPTSVVCLSAQEVRGQVVAELMRGWFVTMTSPGTGSLALELSIRKVLQPGAGFLQFVGPEPRFLERYGFLRAYLVEGAEQEIPQRIVLPVGQLFCLCHQWVYFRSWVR